MRKLLLPVLLCVALAGCKSELFTALPEQDANRIVAALENAGISAEKTAGRNGVSVSVRNTSFARAVNILEELGLPERHYESMGTVFEKSGFVSTQLEEQARYIYALSEELGRTISTIDGVRTARVHVVMPQTDVLGQTQEVSSAAVFLKYDPDVEIEQFTPFIRHMVSNSISGLEFENVSVVTVPALRRAADATDLPAPSAVSVQSVASAILALVLVLCLAAIGAWVFVPTVRDRVDALTNRNAVAS